MNNLSECTAMDMVAWYRELSVYLPRGSRFIPVLPSGKGLVDNENTKKENFREASD